MKHILAENYKRFFKVDLLVEVKTIYTDDSFWDEFNDMISSLKSHESYDSDGNEERQIKKTHKKVFKLDDDFGWDFVYASPDSFYSYDRNGGSADTLSDPRDVKKMLNWLKSQATQ